MTLQHEDLSDLAEMGPTDLAFARVEAAGIGDYVRMIKAEARLVKLVPTTVQRFRLYAKAERQLMMLGAGPTKPVWQKYLKDNRP